MLIRLCSHVSISLLCCLFFSSSIWLLSDFKFAEFDFRIGTVFRILFVFCGLLGLFLSLSLSLSHFVLRHSAFVHLLAAVKIRRNRFIRNASKCAIFPFILYCFWLQAEFLVLLFFSRTTHFRLFILWCKVNYRFCFNPHYSGSITPSSFCLDYQQ